MFYPKNGFMGWHTNGNCPGWNVIMSYTPPPHQGFFEFVDPTSDEHIRLEDNHNIMNGWTIKVGYFGEHSDKDNLIWHCARTYDNPRITLAYVIPQEYKKYYDLMIQDLTTN
jgi:hypothetical protein